MLKRHAIQVLRSAGHTLDEIVTLVAVGKRCTACSVCYYSLGKSRCFVRPGARLARERKNFRAAGTSRGDPFEVRHV